MLQKIYIGKKKNKYIFSIPSKEFIINYLIMQDKPISYSMLCKKFKIHNTHQIQEFYHRLRSMERDEQLIFTNCQRYISSNQKNLLRGTVIGNRNGFGFLRVEGEKEQYYLSTKQMKKAIHGDVVIAQRQREDKNKRCELNIIRVLIPRTNKIVGRFLKNNINFFVVPDDNRFNFNIIVPSEVTNNANIGSIVVVQLIQRPTRYHQPIGKVIEILKQYTGVNMAINIALRTYDIPYIWPKEVIQQTKEFQEEVQEIDKQGRIDLRKFPFITIDGTDACDFDDAVYCEKKYDQGWNLWVAISDVSYYVRPNMPLDQEALRRSTSIYFPSYVIPMLPKELSHGLCSLNPKVDRLCLVCEMIISSEGKISSYKFYEAIINSHARLTYDQAWKFLQNHSIYQNHHISFITSLIQLHKMYQVLEQARIQRGSIFFNTQETKFIFNTDHRIDRIEVLQRNDAHKIIEECMIVSNISAACFIKKHQEPALYRVHDRPSHDHVTSLREILNIYGLNLSGGNDPNSKDYAHMINIIATRPDYDILQTILLRSMKQAIYDTENRGHFGLALPEYVHFTSPIRRYPDLSLHRTIKYLIHDQANNIYHHSTSTGGYRSEIEDILKLSKQCSFNERRADEATRNVSDWLKCDFMTAHIGKSFHGIIIGVTNFGFFVRLNQLLIEGLVHISSLKNDCYHYNNIKQYLIGVSTRKIYQLGDIVEVYISSVHMHERKIDLILVQNELY